MIDENTADDLPVTTFLADSTSHITATVDRGLGIGEGRGPTSLRFSYDNGLVGPRNH